ncbi:Two-component response regulator ARR14 [Glycine soja]
MAKCPTEVSFQFPADLRILAIDDDANIIESYYILYNAPTCSELCQKKKDCTDVILIETHMSNMDGYEFLQHVTKKIHVPFWSYFTYHMMSLDDATSTVMKAIAYGACDYWIKPLHQNQFKIMDPKKNSSNSQESDPDVCYAPPGKKSRLVWQGELHHHQFVKAVNVMQVGLDKAQPKRTLEVMNIPGLTEEHVASRLQKYRLNLKKSNKEVVQQDEMSLPNCIESRGRIGFGATSHDPYASLHPEEFTGNLVLKEDQRPNHYCTLLVP